MLSENDDDDDEDGHNDQVQHVTMHSRKKPPPSGEPEPEPDKKMSAYPDERHASAPVCQGGDTASANAKEIVILRSKSGTSLVAEFQRRAAHLRQRHPNACPGFVYEETMENMLKEGRVYYFAAAAAASAARAAGTPHSSNGPNAELTVLFTRKAMADAMAEHGFFAGRSWTAQENQLELRLAERMGSDGSAIAPRIFVRTAAGNRRWDVVSIAWNGVHLTNESEIMVA
jgi:hypothetical protein